MEPNQIPLNAYNLTVTGTNWTTAKAIGLPYKTLSGTWRIIINIAGTVSATNTLTLTVAGITFQAQHQAVSASMDNNTGFNVYATGGASTIYVNSGTNFSAVNISADVELTSKPTFVE
jgi:hypothetical protein